MVLLIGEKNGLMRVEGGRGRWGEPEMVISGMPVVTVRGDASSGGTVYAGTRGGGLLRGRGDLRHWEAIDSPPAARQIRSLCVQGERVLVGVEPVGVYEWNEGDGWRQLGDIATVRGSQQWFHPDPVEEKHIRYLSVDPNRPQRVYAAIQCGGVGISADGGATWVNKRNLDRDVHSIEPHPTAAGVMFAGTGGCGMYRSRDYGETWEPIGDECGNYVISFAIDPDVPATMYVGTSKGSPGLFRRQGGACGEMYRSDDGGEHWRKLDGGLPQLLRSRVTAVRVDPEEHETVFFACGLGFYGDDYGIGGADDCGAYESVDGGASWRRIVAVRDPLALWSSAG